MIFSLCTRDRQVYPLNSDVSKCIEILEYDLTNLDHSKKTSDSFIRRIEISDIEISFWKGERRTIDEMIGLKELKLKEMGNDCN